MGDFDNLAFCTDIYGCKCEDSFNNTYTCVRTLKQSENSLFCDFADEVNFQEIYDLNEDPFQLHNLFDVQVDYSEHFERLQRHQNCQGFQECYS